MTPWPLKVPTVYVAEDSNILAEDIFTLKTFQERDAFRIINWFFMYHWFPKHFLNGLLFRYTLMYNTVTIICDNKFVQQLKLYYTFLSDVL